MKKWKIIITGIIILALITFLLSDNPLNFFTEEVANNLDTVGKTHTTPTEEEQEQWLEENFIQDENGFCSPKW